METVEIGETPEPGPGAAGAVFPTYVPSHSHVLPAQSTIQNLQSTTWADQGKRMELKNWRTLLGKKLDLSLSILILLSSPCVTCSLPGLISF